MNYNNLFGIGIPDLLSNMLSCHGFLKNNDYVVILKCPNRVSEYYFNKGFFELIRDEDHLKNSFNGQRKSWCRIEGEYRLSHAILYNHNFHFKYTEKLSNQFKLSFILFN